MSDNHQSRPELARDHPNRQPGPSDNVQGGATGPTAEAQVSGGATGPTARAQAAGDGTGPTGQAQTAAGDGKTVEQVVAEAVRKGYEVVGENIRQGRQAAERMRARSYTPAEIPGELRRFADRLLQLSMELGTTWFQLIGAILRDPQLREAFEGAGQEAAPRPAEQVQPVSPPIVYTVRCSRTVEHSLKLHPLTGPVQPTIAGLHSIAPGGHSVAPGRVTFRRNPDGSLLVNITVPDEVPAGTYNGAVIDRDTHEAIGTLRLRIA